MAIANLSNTSATYDDGLDSIVIVDNLQSIRGGRTLDVTGYTPTLIRAGHVIIQATATKQFKPMPVTGVNSISSLGTITGGTGYTPTGTPAVLYAGVALTGGTGTGATADIYVTGGSVERVVLVNKGTGYAAGDVLSAATSTIGTTGSGFSVPVRSVNEAGAYAALPASHIYVGVAVSTVLTVVSLRRHNGKGQFQSSGSTLRLCDYRIRL